MSTSIFTAGARVTSTARNGTAFRGTVRAITAGGRVRVAYSSRKKLGLPWERLWPARLVTEKAEHLQLEEITG